jgi:hypothetical protein
MLMGCDVIWRIMEDRQLSASVEEGEAADHFPDGRHDVIMS